MATNASSSWRDASTTWNSLISAAADAVRSALPEQGQRDTARAASEDAESGRGATDRRERRDGRGRGRRRGQRDGHDEVQGHGHRRSRGHGHGHGRRSEFGPRQGGGDDLGFARSDSGSGFPFGPGGPFGPGFGGHGPGGAGFGPPGFGPPGPWRARGRGRGRGARRRGDVRAAILVLLDEQPRHGYELISEISERSGGVWRPSPGTVYPTLSQLEDEGLLRLERLDGRKTATLTDEGKAYVEEHREQLGQPWTDVAGDVRAENLTLRGVIAQVGIAASTVALHGSPEQATRAAQILEQARQELYGLMAEPKAAADADTSTSATETPAE